MKNIDSFLISTIEDNPKFSRLVRKAWKAARKDRKKNLSTPNTEDDLLVFIKELQESTSLKKRKERKKRQQRNNTLRYLFLSNPMDYYDGGPVTNEYGRKAEITATSVSISNLVDFLLNLPLIYYAFSFLPLGIGISVGFLVGTCILKFGNVLAEGASNRSRGIVWPSFSLVGMILLNVIQSFASGVGTELLNNQNQLSLLRAKELYDEQVKRGELRQSVIDNSSDSKRLKEIKSERIEKEKQFDLMSENDPRRDSLYVDLYGPWDPLGEINWGDSTEDNPNLPLVQREARAQKRIKNKLELENDSLLQKLSARPKYGSEISFIKTEFTDVYNATFFADSQRLKSGVDAVRLATINVFDKVRNNKWPELGFSLYFVSFSFITSLVSVLLVLSFYLSSHNEKKLSDRILNQKVYWLRNVIYPLVLNRHEEELSNLQGNLSQQGYPFKTREELLTRHRFERRLISLLFSQPDFSNNFPEIVRITEHTRKIHHSRKDTDAILYPEIIDWVDAQVVLEISKIKKEGTFSSGNLKFVRDALELLLKDLYKDSKSKRVKSKRAKSKRAKRSSKGSGNR